MSTENVSNEEKVNGVLADVISRLQSLKRYDSSIEGGCECCGSWVEHKADKHGDWVKFDDIEELIEQLRANSL